MMKTALRAVDHFKDFVDNEYLYESVLHKGKLYACKLVIRTHLYSNTIDYILMVDNQEVGLTKNFKSACSIWSCFDEYVKFDDLVTVQIDLEM